VGPLVWPSVWTAVGCFHVSMPQKFRLEKNGLQY
jgi:hypothetical protein